MIGQRNHRSATAGRRGSATVELAIGLPVVVLLVLGTIESCSMIFLQQALTAAAYEGVREGAKSGSTDAATKRCQQVLDARRLVGTSISINPASIESAADRTYVTFSVSAPCGANSVLPSQFFGGRTLTARATMMKE